MYIDDSIIIYIVNEEEEEAKLQGNKKRNLKKNEDVDERN